MRVKISEEMGNKMSRLNMEITSNLDTDLIFKLYQPIMIATEQELYQSLEIQLIKEIDAKDT